MNDLPRDKTIVPPEYRYWHQKAAVISFLYYLDIPALEKKLAFIMWCKMYNIDYTGSDIAKVTGLPPGSL